MSDALYVVQCYQFGKWVRSSVPQESLEAAQRILHSRSALYGKLRIVKYVMTEVVA